MAAENITSVKASSKRSRMACEARARLSHFSATSRYAARTVGWRVRSSAAISWSCCDAVATGSPVNSVIHVLLVVGLAARNRLW